LTAAIRMVNQPRARRSCCPRHLQRAQRQLDF